MFFIETDVRLIKALAKLFSINKYNFEGLTRITKFIEVG
jgi:hypothetical protein